MLRNRNRGRRTRNRGASQRPPNTTLTMHRALTGTVLKNRSDPPTFTATPWNQLTVAIRFVTIDQDTENRSNLNASTIEADIYSQIGFPIPVTADFPAIEFRMSRIRSWCTTGYSAEGLVTGAVGYSTLNMDVYDVVNTNTSDGNSRILQSVSDVSSKLLDANVGYVYPVTQRNSVIQASAQNALIAGFDWRGNILTVYTQVLWRFRPPQNSVNLLNQHQLLSTRYSPAGKV